MKALIIVDVQNDFCEGGALGSPEGSKVIPIINQIKDRFDLVVASRDDHPAESDHFKKWPVHCVTGSKGAQFHDDLDTSGIEKELVKGTDGKDDGFSAFEATNVNLADYLKSKNVKDVYVAGLTTEYCIKETAIDSSKLGFKTYVVSDAIGAVKPDSDDELSAVVEMKGAGVTMVRAAEI